MKTAFHFHSTRGHWAGVTPTLLEQQKLFDWIRREGFDGVDISDSWSFESLDKAAAEQTRQRASEWGLAIPTISCLGKALCHPELGERHFKALERALDTAGWLHASILNVALGVPRTPGVTPVMGAATSPGGSLEANEQDFAVTAQRLRSLALQAKERGLSLCIELHDRSLADTSATLLRILDEVGEPNIGANPDLCNGYRAYSVPGETWHEALQKLAPRTNLWHINNLQRVYFSEIDRAAFVERSLGEGDVDYRLALKTMRAAGFDGWVVIEYKGSGDAFETLSRGQRYFRKLMQETPTGMSSGVL